MIDAGEKPVSRLKRMFRFSAQTVELLDHARLRLCGRLDDVQAITVALRELQEHPEEALQMGKKRPACGTGRVQLGFPGAGAPGLLPKVGADTGNLTHTRPQENRQEHLGALVPVGGS